MDDVFAVVPIWFFQKPKDSLNFITCRLLVMTAASRENRTILYKLLTGKCRNSIITQWLLEWDHNPRKT